MPSHPLQDAFQQYGPVGVIILVGAVILLMALKGSTPR